MEIKLLIFFLDLPEEQDIDEQLSKTRPREDPQVVKHNLLKKIMRDMGVTDSETSTELMAYIDKNVHFVTDPDSGEGVPIIPPFLAKMLKHAEGDGADQDSNKTNNGGSMNREEFMATIRAEHSSSNCDTPGYILDDTLLNIDWSSRDYIPRSGATGKIKHIMLSSITMSLDPNAHRTQHQLGIVMENSAERAMYRRKNRSVTTQEMRRDSTIGFKEEMLREIEEAMDIVRAIKV